MSSSLLKIVIFVILISRNASFAMINDRACAKTIPSISELAIGDVPTHDNVELKNLKLVYLRVASCDTNLDSNPLQVTLRGVQLKLTGFVRYHYRVIIELSSRADFELIVDGMTASLTADIDKTGFKNIHIKLQSDGGCKISLHNSGLGGVVEGIIQNVLESNCNSWILSPASSAIEKYFSENGNFKKLLGNA